MQGNLPTEGCRLPIFSLKKFFFSLFHTPLFCFVRFTPLLHPFLVISSVFGVHEAYRQPNLNFFSFFSKKEKEKKRLAWVNSTELTSPPFFFWFSMYFLRALHVISHFTHIFFSFSGPFFFGFNPIQFSKKNTVDIAQLWQHNPRQPTIYQKKCIKDVWFSCNASCVYTNTILEKKRVRTHSTDVYKNKAHYFV